MTGPEHYREAERHLSAASFTQGPGGDPIHPETAAHHLAMAQAHATLALAAATAMGAAVDGEADSGLPPRDAEAWYDAAGVKKPKGGTA